LILATFAAMDKKGHSEEYFHEGRMHWYNPDFLDLMAKRWGLQSYRSLLDIGAGMCHWTKLLAPYLQPEARVVALDNDIKWSRSSGVIEHFFRQHQIDFDYKKATAYQLPFPDNSFDVVTCQTLLIHLSYPEKALLEMKRVVKKDGIVICVEPSNRIQAIMQDSSNQNDNIDKILARVKNSLATEKLKMMNNDGNNSFGDLLTGTMNGLGFREIQSYLNDKLISVYPPYNTPEQQAVINAFLTEGQTAAERATFEQHYQDSQDYMDFIKKHKPARGNNKILDAIKDKTYSNAGTSLMYMISGKK
jgi:ubiquinone/menaquinone biosynthesis C-methylase UbiE